MRIKIEIDNSISDDEIIIKCNSNNQQVEELHEYIKNKSEQITVIDGDNILKILISKVYYFESIDKNTYVYVKDNVFHSELKLYEIEKNYEAADFLRISKSCILNLSHLKSVKRLFNGRLIAKLSNGEEVIINRKYVQNFKERFGV